ncbi:MAG: efflux RND transporter periplasmic adaptor subunit [Planctomyces sp.]
MSTEQINPRKVSTRKLAILGGILLFSVIAAIVFRNKTPKVAGVTASAIGETAGTTSERAQGSGMSARKGDAEPVTPPTELVELTEDKLKTLQMQISPAERRQLRPTHTVPGRLRYDELRHVEVRSSTDGILTGIHVKPGDRVMPGHALVELNSPEVGNARADMLQREAALQLVMQRRDWAESASQGLEKLNSAIREEVPVDDIQKQFRNVSLGTSREKLMSAYSQLILSKSLSESAEQTAASGAIPRRTLQERQSEQDQAEAMLNGTMEQLQFETKQSFLESQNDVADAERRLAISRQTVRTLLGFSGLTEDINKVTEIPSDGLSRISLTAPFAGTVEQLRFSLSERVNAGDPVCVIADTATLWVAADLRDRDREALSLTAGDSVDVYLKPDDPDPRTAIVHYVGREVDPATNAVPLIAVIPNPDLMLRPGMFVSVRVPVAVPIECLTIPASAVMEHESRRFVFVPEGNRKFRRVDVTTGLKCDDQIEILSGLHVGDQVVSEEAFVLKSELILRGEEE